MTLIRRRLKTVFVLTLIFTLCVTTLFSGIGYAGYAAAQDVADEGEILSFERMNPVESIEVYRDTAFEDLDLPDSLRVLMSIADSDKENFVQSLPQADEYGEYDFYWYGYIQDADAQTKYDNGERVLYTISYADGTKAYRVYGNLGDGFDRFFACDENGNIKGELRTVEVAWDESQYDSGLYESVQQLTPVYSSELRYDGKVYAEITVSRETEDSIEHEDEPDADEAESDSGNGSVIPNGSEPSTWKDESENSSSEADGAASNASSTRSQKAVAAIKQYTPTSNNKVISEYSTGVPGSWVDYVNTIWMNKLKDTAVDKDGDGQIDDFVFAESNVSEAWKWNSWMALKEPDEGQTAADDPLVIPTAKAVTGADASYYQVSYDVYSVEQLLYALAHNSRQNRIINIKQNLDFNGAKRNWSPPTIGGNVRIDGSNAGKEGNENAILYNLMSYQNNSGGWDTGQLSGAFINLSDSCGKIEICNIEFQSAYSICFYRAGGGLFGTSSAYSSDDCSRGSSNMKNVMIKDSVFYNGSRTFLDETLIGGKHISPWGMLNGDEASGTNYKINMSNCYVSGCKVYGNDHVCAFVSRVWHGIKSSYCFVTDTVLCGTGGHSAGFVSCQMENKAYCTDCFVNLDMYATTTSGGFTAIVGGIYERCFTTGKLEGYYNLGGFACQPNEKSTFTDCYSTMLVGMRSASHNIGGFIDLIRSKSNITFKNCYAAGELGDYSTDSTSTRQSNNKSVGGFVRAIEGSGSFTNCYYDKQTTAVREWVTSKINAERGESVEGITGVLTSTTNKSGVGLTGDYTKKSSKFSEEFKGFIDNDVWVFIDGFYPQIKNLRWGSGFSESVNSLVKANSFASAATVYLDTWDSGYDWSNTGVRSKSEQAYARTKEDAFSESKKDGYSAHVGYQYTYDTVREIVSDFQVTRTNTSFIPLLGKETLTIEDGSGTVNAPGVEWMSISSAAYTSGLKSIASRPIRLVSLMSVDAGADKSLKINELYDHTKDARFTIIDELTDDLIVGMDDAKTWASLSEQAYPSSKKYYEAVTSTTNFGASKDAWVYTEISLIEENGQTLPEPKSVRVTGAGTNKEGSRTTTERQWLGELPIGSGFSVGMKFKLTYYWMLSDGRYCSDSKLVTLIPGEYTLTESVYNQNGSSNSTALYLGTLKGETPGVSEQTLQTSSLSAESGERVLAAWAKNPQQDLDVVSLKLRFSDAGIAMSDTVELKNPKTGDEFSIDVKYYGYEEKTDTEAPGGAYERMTLSYVPVDVKLTYTIEERMEGTQLIQYLKFDHIASVKGNELSCTQGSLTIPSMDDFDTLNMLLQAIDRDIEVILIVPDRCNLMLQKQKGGTESTETATYLENVKFQMYAIEPEDAAVPEATIAELKDGTKGSVATDIYTDSAREEALAEGGIITDASGKLSLYGLNSGKYYYLVETQPLAGYANLTQMVRIYLDPKTSTASLQRLDSDGKALGTALKYVYSNSTEKLTDTTLQLGTGDFISLSILNFETIDMPTTGGAGTYIFLLLGALLAALALTALYYRLAIYGQRE